MNLKQTLGIFQKAILENNNQSKRILMTALKEPPIGNLEDRVSVYMNGISRRQKDIISKNYPAFFSYIGIDNFNSLIELYISSQSLNRNKNDWSGLDFPDFYSKNNINLKSHPYALSMLSLEHRLIMSMNSSYVQPIKLEEIQFIEESIWPKLAFKFQPNLYLLNLQNGTIELYEKIRIHGSLEMSSVNDYEQHGIIIWKREDQVFYRSVEMSEFIALNKACNGHNVSEIRTFMSQAEFREELISPSKSNEENDELFAQFLSQWLVDGLVTSYNIV